MVENNKTTLLKMRGIIKSFPGVLALNSVDFDLQAGEVHVLLGENFAGKSTLIKILSGAYQLDDGEIFPFPYVLIKSRCVRIKLC